MRSVLLHGALALLGLLAAYQTWTRVPEDEARPGEVNVTTCSAAELQTIHLQTPANDIDVRPQKQGNETLYWITVQHRAKDVAKSKPLLELDKKADAPKRFLAKSEFADYVKRIAPLRALRALGVLPKAKLADFGFDKVDTYLDVTCGGKPLQLELGARTFGTGQRYARDRKTQATYLFDEPVISDLQSAQFKFMQSDLHSFTLDDIDEVSVQARGAEKHLVHRDRNQPDHSTWVDASAPARRNELYGNWFGKLGRLRVREFLSQGAEPGSELPDAGAEVTPLFTLDYKLEGKTQGKLELVRVDAAGVGHYYARSETTRGWVSVFDSAGKDAEQDVGMVVGLDEPAPAAKPAKPAPAAESGSH